MIRNELDSFWRFAAVAAAGLVVDLAVAAGGLWVGLPIYAAAGVGFIAGAAFNYVIHELWTFRGGRAAALSGLRAALYIAVLGAVLGARVGTVSTLAFLAPSLPIFMVLGVGVAVSLSVNWGLSRYVVFRRDAGRATP